MNHFTKQAFAIAFSLVGVACADGTTDGTITGTNGITDQCVPVTAKGASTDSATSAGRWNVLTRLIASRHELGPTTIARSFALVSAAQYNADLAAVTSNLKGTGQSVVGAGAGAAAAVLTGLYPTEQPVIDAQLVADSIAVSSVSGACAARISSSIAAGRAIGAAALAYAASDGSSATWTGTVPVGAGLWTSAPAPAVPFTPLWGQVRPWIMTAGNQFRPAAPPAFGSAAYQTALAEVRQLSDTRTADQLRIAQYWGTIAGTAGPAGLWSASGLALAAKAGVDELGVAQMLATMHVAAMDAIIACWDGKYTYWYIRPFQADPAITTPVGRPNFPSYPSAHSCLSATYATVLEALYPSAVATLDAAMVEAGEARIYAGLHFRFDVEAGQAIGRSIGKLAVARLSGGTPIPLR